MRIVAFGDTYTQHRDLQVPGGDVLLFAGDGEFRTLQDIIDFDHWLSDLEYEEIIVIAGTMIFSVSNTPNEVGNYLM